MLLLLLISVVSGVGGTSARAEAPIPGTVDVRREKGFARIIVKFDRLPAYETETVSTIFVAKFKEPVAIDLSEVSTKLPDYISIARQDPDGLGFRMAMMQGFKVNVMRAGHRLIVDILGRSWKGRPPGMPQDVIDALAREAEEARRLEEERAKLEAMQLRPLLVEVRHAKQPSFDRIEFDWNRLVTASFTRKGNEIIIKFGGRALPNLAPLQVNLPAVLKSIRHEIDREGLSIIMTVVKGTRVRAFREGKNYIVDLTSPKGSQLSELERKVYAATGQDPAGESSGNTDEEIILNGDDWQGETSPNDVAPASPPFADKNKPETNKKLAGTEKPPVPVRPEAAPKSESSERREAAVEATPAPRAARPPVESAPTLSKPDLPAEKAPPPPQTEPAPAPPSAETKVELQQRPTPAPASVPLKPAPKRAAGKIMLPTEGLKPPSENRTVKPIKGKIKVVRNGNTVEMHFPYNKEQVAAAIFQHDNKLSILVDSKDKIDLEGLQEQLAGIVTDVRREQLEDDAQLFEFRLSGPWLSSVDKQTAHWSINIGDLMTSMSDSFDIEKRQRSDGRPEAFVPISPNGRLHHIRDTDSGDELVVLTAPAPARNIRYTRNFVDFQVYASIHGVVVRPLSDDLTIENDSAGLHIERPDGLRLSGSDVQEVEQSKSSLSTRRSVARNMEFTGDLGETLASIDEQTVKMEKALSETEGDERTDQMLDLTRHLLSQGMAPESYGFLEMLASEQAEAEKDPVFRLLRGISNVLLRRYKQADVDLSTSDLEDNPHAALWRGVAAYEQRNFQRALIEFKRGEPALDAYRPEQQALFRLDAADTALHQGELDLVGKILDAMPADGISPKRKAETQYIEGRLMEAQKRPQEAMRLYADAIAADIPPLTAKAVYHLTDLKLRLGEIRADEGIEMLERLSIIWRGDETELKVLHRLSDLYLEEGRYDEAFVLMETAVKAYPSLPLALDLQDRMKEQFEELFLHGKADSMPPVKALALFYEHKDLTPPGRLGDEMIRLLADRLIAVDLLDKAAELLDHQVNRRLKGAGRAQVAIRLAMIHLLQHRPKLALQTLHRTSQPRLPQQVVQARKILEARAFAELGRSGAVLELLAGDSSKEAEEIKSLALWNAEQWTAAGEQYERTLAGRWQDKKDLSPEERIEVLRSAISYTLGGDTLGLQRIREKYGALMATGPDSSAFSMITDPVEAKNGAIDKLAREIADIDTLEAFVKAFKQRFENTDNPDTTSATQ